MNMINRQLLCLLVLKGGLIVGFGYGVGYDYLSGLCYAKTELDHRYPFCKTILDDTEG